MTDHFRSQPARGAEVLLLTGHSGVTRVVREALRRPGALRACRDWNDLLEAVRSTAPRARVLVDPFHGSSGRLSPGLIRLLGELPSTRVLALVDGRTVGMSRILELGQLGVAEILDTDAELTPRAIRARLDQVPPDAFRSLLDVSDLQHLAGRGRLLIERAAEVAARGGYPKDLAAAMGMGTATLRRWMHDAGLPPPRDLFRWLRVLLAASLLDDPGRTVQDAAMGSGYSDASGLRRAMNAVTRRPPSELRDEGAYQSTLRSFLVDMDVYARESADAD